MSVGNITFGNSFRLDLQEQNKRPGADEYCGQLQAQQALKTLLDENNIPSQVRRIDALSQPAPGSEHTALLVNGPDHDSLTLAQPILKDEKDQIEELLSESRRQWLEEKTVTLTGPKLAGMLNDTHAHAEERLLSEKIVSGQNTPLEVRYQSHITPLSDPTAPPKSDEIYIEDEAGIPVSVMKTTLLNPDEILAQVSKRA
jgi:hypothetical protein